MENKMKVIIMIMCFLCLVGLGNAYNSVFNINGGDTNNFNVSDTGIIDNLIITSAPVECTGNTRMTYFNGSHSICSDSMGVTGDSVTGDYTFIGEVNISANRLYLGDGDTQYQITELNDNFYIYNRTSGSTNAIFVYAGGNYGIGSDGTPNEYLDVQGAILADGVIYSNANSGNNYFLSNVGIGTTTPTKTLEVNGGGSNYVANFKSTDQYGGITFQDSTTDIDHVAIYADGNAIGFEVNDERDVMYIDTTGYVGIGTTTPDSRLDVDGGTDNTNAVITSTDSDSCIGLQDNDTTLYYSNRICGDANYLELYSNNAVAMTIDDSQNVGIGTTTPTANLEVSQTSTTGETIYAYRNLASASTDSPVMQITQDNVGDDQIALRINQVGSNAGMSIYPSSISTGMNVYGTSGLIQTKLGADYADTDGTNWFYRNLASANTAAPVVFIEQDQAGDDQVALKIQNDGSASSLYILNSLNKGQGGNALSIEAYNSTRGIYSYTGLGVTGYNTKILAAQDNGAGLWTYTNVGGGASEPLVFIEADNTAFDQPTLKIQQDGTGNSLNIDQNGDGVALNIDSEATSILSTGINLDMNDGTAIGFLSRQSNNDFVTLSRPNNASSTASNWIYRNLNSASTDVPLFFIEQDNAGDDQPALQIQQDSDKEALLIKGSGGNNEAIYLGRADNAIGMAYFIRNLASADTAGPVINVVQDNAGDDQVALSVQNDGTGRALAVSQNGDVADGAFAFYNTGNTQRGMWVYSNQDGTANQELMLIEADNVAFDQPALKIQQDGTGNGLNINQNGVNYGLQVNHASAATGAILAYYGSSQYTAIGNSANDATAINHFYRNYDSGTTASPLVFIENDNSGDDQPALKIQQDGTSAYVELDTGATITSNSTCLILTSPDGSGRLEVCNT